MLCYTTLEHELGNVSVELLIFLEVTNAGVICENGYYWSLKVRIVVYIPLVDKIKARGFAQLLDVINGGLLVNSDSILTVVDDDIFEAAQKLFENRVTIEDDGADS